MNATGLAKYAGALAALAMFSACSGGSGVAPSSPVPNVRYVGNTPFVNGRPVTAARPYTGAPPRFEMLAPDVVEGRKREYVFNSYGTYATIFDYPKSDQQVGSINGLGGQGCTDVLYGYGKRTFWNVGGQTQVTEFKVRGSVPVKTLSISFSFPTSCAMDTSGDIAIGNYDGGQVAIYKGATGTPTIYNTALDEEFFDGYDPSGNLFADGFTADRSGFAFVELAKGSTTFKTITLPNAIIFPGSVQWDGKYVTVYDQIANALYQYTVSGTTATLEGTISLDGVGDCAQTWIAKGVIFCGDDFNNDGSVFKYPGGGSAIGILTGNFVGPLGVVAAEKL